MLYTVQQVADISGVTVKTLYHYHKIGLLPPQQIAANGYRYYGQAELERLQQILFYRELGLSLEAIGRALAGAENRLACLCEQQALLHAQRQRLEEVLRTLQATIEQERNGEPMTEQALFQGLNREQWQEALQAQNEVLQEQYDFTLPLEELNAEELNRQAAEATQFMTTLADCLRAGLPITAGRVQEALRKHIAFLGLEAAGFSGQCRFFLADDFHRGMLEAQQVGLSYYLCLAAEALAACQS